MRNLTKIGLLLGALAVPAYADPPTSGAKAGSNSLGAPADDGSSQLGAKSKVKPGSHTATDDGAAKKDDSSKDYRVDVDANDKASAKHADGKANAKRHDTGASAGTGAGAGAEPDDNH